MCPMDISRDTPPPPPRKQYSEFQLRFLSRRNQLKWAAVTVNSELIECMGAANLLCGKDSRNEYEMSLRGPFTYMPTDLNTRFRPTTRPIYTCMYKPYKFERSLLLRALYHSNGWGGGMGSAPLLWPTM